MQPQTNAIPTTYPSEATSIQNLASDASTTPKGPGNQQSGEYLPGVIDKLDAQVLYNITTIYVGKECQASKQ